MATESGDEDGDGEEWRYSLTDLEDESEAQDDEEDSESSGEGIAGSMEIDEELEAGDIDLENAFFVVVGVLLAVAFVLGFATLLV